MAAMTLAEWVIQINNLLPRDWLEFFSERNRTQQLFDILQELHLRYAPQTDGTWGATPKWTEMFSWTSCPVDAIRAVILLKGPNRSANCDYENAGYGGGVRRTRSRNQDWQPIVAIDTVWKLFQICYSALLEPPVDVEEFRAMYINGFNPERLSKRGILFLNVSLTNNREAGIDEEYAHNSDMELWRDFTLGILQDLPVCKVPLFQWYITQRIEATVDEVTRNGQFVVSKPTAITFESSPRHICGFTLQHVEQYGGELREERYRDHRAILAEMYAALRTESHRLTYPPPEDAARAPGMPAEGNEAAIEA